MKRPLQRLLFLSAVVLPAALSSPAAAVQIPGISGRAPDTLAIVADTTEAVRADTTTTPSDADSTTTLSDADTTTTLADPDSSAIQADSSAVVPDPLFNLSSGPACSYELGVWCWDRAALLSTRAVTLAELVGLIPGVIALRGGDYGTPVTDMSFGLGGGRVRVLWDDFEWVPLEGAVPDLARIGLAGLEEVRVERRPGELLIAFKTREPTDPEPVTLVEVGTGDLSTNLLRGTFVHPTAFGGAFTFALDRLETRGPGLDAAGSLSGFVLRYARSLGERGGVVADMRRLAPRTDVSDLTTGLTRNDWNVRARWRFTESLIGEGYLGASSLSGGLEEPVYGGLDTRRTQIGLRTEYTVGNFWARGAVRGFAGHGVQRANFELAGGGFRASGASVDGSMRLERWSGQHALSWRARIETAPLRGFSLFATYEAGEMGAPFVGEYEAYLRSLRPGPPLQPDPVDKPRPRFTDRTGIRAGASFSHGGIHVSGAWLAMKADSVRPLGLILDGGGITVAGGDLIGFEATARAQMPSPFSGFALEGAVQAWDQDLPYLPKRLWDGAVTFHGIFQESRNLELWAGLGVTGRDPMSLAILESGGDPAVPDLVTVPLSEEWYTYIQVRIVTVNFFIRWENVRGKSDNVDFPDRTQPRIRTLYGVKWTLRN